MTTPSRDVEIYCVKSRAKTGSRNIEAVTMMNGCPATNSVDVYFGTARFHVAVLP